MANVATLIAMDPTYQPFERPPDPLALWTPIPRGLRGFIVELGALDLKPVGDTQTLVLTATLPPSFAYVFAEISLRISQDRAQSWFPAYTLNLQNWYQGRLGVSTSFAFPWNGIDHGNQPLNTERSNGFTKGSMVPKAPMWAPSGTSGILIRFNAQNADGTVATAGTLSAYINFWEFDLEQARKFPINSPIPTHQR